MKIIKITITVIEAIREHEKRFTLPIPMIFSQLKSSIFTSTWSLNWRKVELQLTTGSLDLVRVYALQVKGFLSTFMCLVNTLSLYTSPMLSLRQRVCGGQVVRKFKEAKAREP